MHTCTYIVLVVVVHVRVASSPGPLVRREGPGNHCICIRQSYHENPVSEILRHEREGLSTRLSME